MDAFRILTGGTRLDKKRFQADVAHFEVRTAFFESLARVMLTLERSAGAQG